METLFVYLIKSGALIALFWLAYHFLLRKETFFRTNRWFLLAGLSASVILPLVTFKKIIVIEPAPAYAWTNMPVAISAEDSFEVNWWLIAAAVYMVGITAFLLRFCTDFYALKKTLRGKRVLRQADFKLVDTPENIAPFSYFNYIVYNSSLYTESELQNILAHEKVHSDQHHSIDVLVMRFFCITFWFNPFIWLYKKSVLQNLEFIADSEATKNITDKRSYQITLLKVTAHENCVEITNHFYQSLIKKRIVMLNKNQSKPWQSWKYALVIPILAAFMLYFQVKVIAQEKEPEMSEHAIMQGGVRVVVDKNTSDSEMKKDAEMLKKEHGVTLKFSKVKRNKNGEIIAIKAEFKDKNGKKGVTHISGDEPIKPISFYRNEDGAIGFGNSRDVRIWHRDGLGHGAEDIDLVYVDVEAPEHPEPPLAPDGVETPHPPKAPGHPNVYMKRESGDRHVIIRNDNNGKPTVIVNGEVVEGADAEKILADMEPMKGGYAYHIDDDHERIIIDSKEIAKISREAADKARVEIMRMRPAMEKMRSELRRMEPEIERARIHEIRSRADEEISREEMKQAKREIEQAREEIQKAKQEIEKARMEIDKAQSKK